MLQLILLWTGPLPAQHIWIASENRPTDPKKLLRVYIRKWLFHPLKRRIAKYYLAYLKTQGLKVIAITGSAGKTTTKEMLLSILSLEAPTVASFANIDPVYNIPTTILRCNLQTKFLILEMGIEYPGEMDFYTWLAKPDIAIITNVNLTHTLYLKSLKTVAAEKGRIGVFAKHLLINRSDLNIEINTSGQVHKIRPEKFKLKLLGNHLQINAALAAKAAQLLDIKPEKIKLGLEKLEAQPHRMQLITNNKLTLIDDSYNANPLATKASIDALIDYAKRSKKTPVFVFGQMNELGDFEESAHQEIGDYVQKSRIEHFFTIGPATKNLGRHFKDIDSLVHFLRRFLKPSHVILVKGSRSWKLETVVNKLTS